MDGVQHPSPAYWERQGWRRGWAEAESTWAFAITEQERQQIMLGLRRGDAPAIYQKFGPTAALPDDETIADVFAEQAKNVPHDWRVAYEYGYSSGWWQYLSATRM